MGFVSSLYRIARVINTTKALTSGDPNKMARRAKNIAVGRLLGRTKIWR